MQHSLRVVAAVRITLTHRRCAFLSQTAQAPMVEMTKNLLQEQKEKLEQQKQQLLQENKKLQQKVAKGEAQENELSERQKNEELLKNITAAYETKSKQLNSTIEEQKRRRQVRFATLRHCLTAPPPYFVCSSAFVVSVILPRLNFTRESSAAEAACPRQRGRDLVLRGESDTAAMHAHPSC